MLNERLIHSCNMNKNHKFDQDIFLMIHLFYLVLLLNQIICYFSKADRDMVLSINDFFHEYENSMDVIEKTPSREYLLSYEYEHNLIK